MSGWWGLSSETFATEADRKSGEMERCHVGREACDIPRSRLRGTDRPCLLVLPAEATQFAIPTPDAVAAVLVGFDPATEVIGCLRRIEMRVVAHRVGMPANAPFKRLLRAPG